MFQFGGLILSIVYKNMKKSTLPLIILLIVSLLGGLMLVRQNQDTRKSASFADTKLMLLPSEKIVKKVGEIVPVKVYFQTESGARVDGVQTVVCYGEEIFLDQETGIIVNTENGFESDPIVIVNEVEEGKWCATMVATSKKAADKLITTGEVFALNFTAVSEGEGPLTITQTKSMVTGDNPASATDKEIAITSVEDTSYQIVGDEIITGDEPILNYKVSFGYVDANGDKCVVDWPMEIMVLANGESKVYSDVVARKIGEANGIPVYEGSLQLKGFNSMENVAAFFKGPKHLQMKYATQNQSATYGKAPGELILTTSQETSPVYDFTSYPMIAGDVIGVDSDEPDNWINGLDFSYVKTRALTHESVDEGGYLKADLDGNCQVNSRDVMILKISLETKQGQLY